MTNSMRYLQFFICITITFLISCNTNNSAEKNYSDTTKNLVDTTANKKNTETEFPKISKDALLKLQIKSSVVVGPLTLSFGKFIQANEFLFDRYPTYSGSKSRLFTAERGNKFLISNVDITSSDKAPNLPCIFLYEYSSGSLMYVGTFDYRLYHWEDYATFLGNYHDNHNDFRYTSKIKFSIGYEDDAKILSNHPLFVLIKKENAISRNEDRFGNPPVSYPSTDCHGIDNFTLGIDKFKDFEVVAIINKDKLKSEDNSTQSYQGNGITSESRFVRKNEIIMSGLVENIQGEGVINGRTDKLLPETNSKNKQAAIEFNILIRNNGSDDITIIPANTILLTTSGEKLNTYPGEKSTSIPASDDFISLSPTFIESNGKDISSNHFSNLKISKGEFAVMQVSFPMKQRYTESAAIRMCKEIEVPIPQKRISLSLKFKK